MKGSPSSSERALTSLRPDLPLRPAGPGSGHLTIDKFLSQLGNPGRFQIFIMLLLASNCIPVVVNHLLMAFYAVSTPHHCKLPENETDISIWLPRTTTDISNATIQKYSECEMFIDPNNRSLGTQSCVHGYTYLVQDNEWNIIAEWNLVCDRHYLAALTTTLYFCGVCLGGVIFGALSDRFGRKSMMLICLYTQCTIGLVIHFVSSLVVFISLRFIQGIFIQGLQCVTYSMVLELFGPTYRTMAGCVIEGFWAVGIIILALIAKYVQDWRFIQLAINVPTLATIFYIWIVPESLRWLLSRGKYSRATSVVKRIVWSNNLQLDETFLKEEIEELGQILSMQNTQNKQPDIRDILTNKGIRKHTLALFFIWFSVSLAYYGISFSIPDLSGDRYLNFMIGGGIELGAYLLAFVVLNGFGRKYSLMVYLFLSGFFCIAAVSVQQFVPAELMDTAGLSTGLALVGKAAVVSCFCCIFIYSSEIFPTLIRTVGVGACAFWGRVGSLLAPQILLAGAHIYSAAPRFVTFLIFGFLSVIAGFLTLLLPETLNRDLPDTVREAEHLGDQDDDLENTYGQTLGSGLEEEVGYGKSPEWVEVDGHIVSKGVVSLAREHGQDPRSGSVLSLPYSSRTQLTYNSSSSCQSGSGTRSRGSSGKKCREDLYKIETENDYETIPADISAAFSPPPMLTTNHENFQQDSLDRQDTSVISAHQQHSTSDIYDDILRRQSGEGGTSTTSTREIDSLHGYYYIRKNLLMSDANETRL